MNGTHAGTDVEDGQALDGTGRAAAEALDQPAGRRIRTGAAIGPQVVRGRRRPELVADGTGAARPADRARRSVLAAGGQARTSWRMNRTYANAKNAAVTASMITMCGQISSRLWSNDCSEGTRCASCW